MAANYLDFLPEDSLRFIPIFGRIVVDIIKIAQQISVKVNYVKANKRECSALSERIDRVISHLKSPDFQKAISSYGDALKQTLRSFYKFLEECHQFVSSLSQTQWLTKFLRDREHKEQITYFNEQLGLFYNELNLGMNIGNLSHNKQDDNKDVGIFSSRLTDKSTISSSNDIFVDGTWSLRYSKYGAWYGPFIQQMTFNSNNNGINGKGENNVGKGDVSNYYISVPKNFNLILLSR
jgi:hypothetical protein